MKKQMKLFLAFMIILINFPLFSIDNEIEQATSDALETVSLREIDALIKETYYENALDLLNRYIVLHPDDFDSAQRRIKKILSSRQRYSYLWDRLLYLSVNEPQNDKDIYEVSSEMEMLEKHPPVKITKFISDAKRTAEFSYFKALSNSLQEDSAALSSSGKYVDAALKASEGFWLYKENFYNDWKDYPKIINRVDEIVSDVNKLLIQYSDSAIRSKLSSSVDSFVKSVNQNDYNTSVSRLRIVVQNSKELLALREKIYKDGSELQEIFNSSLKTINPDITDASYLPFLSRFILGLESVQNSGIMGAIDKEWFTYVDKMINATENTIGTNYKSFYALLPNKLFENTDKVKKVTQKVDSYISLRNFCILSSSVNDLYSLEGSKIKIAEKIENSRNSNLYISNIIEKISVLCMNAALMGDEIKYQNEVVQNFPSNSSSSDLNKSTYLNNLFNSLSKTVSIAGNRTNYDLNGFNWANDYKKIENPKWNEITSLYSSFVDDMYLNTTDSLITVWKTISSYYDVCTSSIIAKVDSDSSSIALYKDGINKKLTSKQVDDYSKDLAISLDFLTKLTEKTAADSIFYYPNILSSNLVLMNNFIDENVTSFDNVQKTVKSIVDAHPDWLEILQINDITQNINAFLTQRRNNLLSFKENIDSLKKDSDAQIQTAYLARYEAEFRLTQARKDLNSEKFDSARKNLQEALRNYNISFASCDDPTLRDSVDKSMLEIGESISRQENELVVRQVRELKTQAMDAYFNERFEDAEKYITQAQSRWAVTNVDEDEEINDIMNMVNSAISMKTGREILPSAPLYKEMSQLLSLASQYFEDGNKKISEGKTEEGFAVLNNALLTLKDVQIVYPLNQTASVLTLRINKLMDPDKFNEEFPLKIQNAQQLFKSSETRQTGYTSICDYYDIDPKYKGLADIKEQMEYDIGIKQRPIDRSAVARSQRLAQQAQSIFNSAGTNETRLKQALELVNQAISLNRNNNSAIILKDNITLKIGGNASAVLSTEDENLYLQAVSLLQNNDIFGADAIVNELLKKPQNANSKKIRDLKKRIDARR